MGGFWIADSEPWIQESFSRELSRGAGSSRASIHVRICRFVGEVLLQFSNLDRAARLRLRNQPTGPCTGRRTFFASVQIPSASNTAMVTYAHQGRFRPNNST